MNVAVIGSGYVGLVAGSCLAELGHRIVCVDKDEAKVEGLREGRLPIYEPGLEELLPKNVEAGRLSFTTDIETGVAGAEVIFIAVGTPMGSDGGADLGAVMAVAEAIGEALDGYKVVVTKSTVPVGTNEAVRDAIAGQTELDFDVVSNPEFLREGVAIPDFLDPDRIVLGLESDRARETMERLYAPLLDKGAALFVMGIRSAELTKYAANAMLATRISFMNEIANLCDAVGADVEHVREGIGSDDRIGPKFLRAGVGFGGSCFPKDVQALLHTAWKAGTHLHVLDSVEQVNVLQKRRMVEIILRELGQDLSGRRFAMWGLAFKPDTDDMRRAPSIDIARGLLDKGATVVAFDPEALETAYAELGDSIEYADDAYEALRGADALVLVTEWAAFKAPDWERVRELLGGTHVFDGRNLWSPDQLAAAGFIYRGVGRRVG